MIRRSLTTPTATLAVLLATAVSTAFGASLIVPQHSDSDQRVSATSTSPQAAHKGSGTEQKVLPTANSGTAQATTTKTAAAPTVTATKPWSPRPVEYPKTVTTHDIPIRMSDGTILRADLVQPADANGIAIAKKFPVIVTITAYNKNVGTSVPALGGGSDYLVQRGYIQLTVDARGTGSSAGQWCSFCLRENRDGTEVMNWAHSQSWSNGNTGMRGASYLGISQIFAAAGHPAGLKAIFPQVPAYDVYRDVVASGGQVDAGFMPFWLGLVTATGIVPPTTPSSDSLGNYVKALTDHAQGAANFTGPMLLKALFGLDSSYDSSFYQQRSPGSVISKVDVPTFIVGGEYDIFQRGEPMLFDNLNRRGVPTKIIIGPWNHLQASAGTGLETAGYGNLNELQLRWFDHYVKGVADPTLNSIANFSYYEIGSGKWQRSPDYLGANRQAIRYNLSGTSQTAGASGVLTSAAPTAGKSDVYPIPVAGLCTRSTDQWTAGLSTELPFPNPCFSNNAWNDKSGVVFSTPALTKAFRFQGPINAHLNVSSTTGDGLLSVAVEDEAPDGTVTRITGGWQVISLSALDASKSRYLNGQLIQPYHPFTKASRQALAKGQIAPVDVEIFPTGAVILPGHKLRIAVQSFDTPHLISPLPSLAGQLGVISIFSGAAHPSWVTLPGVR